MSRRPTRSNWAASCRQVALALQRLIGLSAVRDTAAIGILMICAGAFLRGVFAERRQIAEETGVPGRKMIFVIEEGWAPPDQREAIITWPAARARPKSSWPNAGEKMRATHLLRPQGTNA